MTDKTEQLYNQLINSIIYQDKHILIINKPMNFPVQGGNKVTHSIDKTITRLSLDPLERQNLKGGEVTSGQRATRLNLETLERRDLRGGEEESGQRTRQGLEPLERQNLKGGEATSGQRDKLDLEKERRRGREATLRQTKSGVWGNRSSDFDSSIFYRLTHRIDKDTSGALILAKSEKAAQKITKMFQDKKVYKTYLALVVGVPENKVGTINKPIVKKKMPGGKEVMQVGKKDKNVKQATTKYKVIDQLGDKLCLLEIEPITGRKHQIRIHLASIGIPILGDGKYGGKRAFVGNLSNKIHLHSYKIFIENYFGKPLSIKAPLSTHLKDTFDTLGIEIFT